MKKSLSRIIEEYLSEKAKSLDGSIPRNSSFANFIRKDASDAIRNRAALPLKYKVKGGPGQGNWAEIPWICIFDSQITTSAERGYYVVYLFRSDMSGVYLSLNMGWTQFEQKFKPMREAQQKIRETAAVCKELIESSLADFSYDPIDLITTRKLGVGYELGHICGKFYSKYNMPEDDVLVDDLRNLIGVYRELTGLLKTKDITNLLTRYREEQAEQEDAEDREYQRNVEKAKPKKITPGPQKKPGYTESKGLTKWNKDAGIARNCLEMANYECQVNPTHKTFTSKVTNNNYVEVHHLAPMEFQEKFQYSLDVPPNIISLCPNCHSRFHHAIDSDRNEIIEQFFNHRKSELETYGIRLSLEQLLEMYNKPS